MIIHRGLNIDVKNAGGSPINSRHNPKIFRVTRGDITCYSDSSKILKVNGLSLIVNDDINDVIEKPNYLRLIYNEIEKFGYKAGYIIPIESNTIQGIYRIVSEWSIVNP